ncbi:hypothetical protein Rctr85_075 [Virus Rctr85]|nr:hypothetical protein Rctr85_075 [Virus Rctr85]
MSNFPLENSDSFCYTLTYLSATQTPTQSMLPNNYWFPDVGRYQFAAIKLLAKLAVRTGFTAIEPAATLRESWQRAAVQMGIRLYRQSDWNLFWLRVAYQIVDLHLGLSAAGQIAREVQKTMVVPNKSPFWRRASYFFWAARSQQIELQPLRQLLTLVLARAAFDADERNVDRPSWFNETVAIRDALETPVAPALPVVTYPNAEGAPTLLSIEKNGKEGSLTPTQARALAFALLDAAEAAELVS